MAAPPGPPGRSMGSAGHASRSAQRPDSTPLPGPQALLGRGPWVGK